MIELVPAIESADPAVVQSQIDRAATFARTAHIDLADGQFVEQTTIDLTALSHLSIDQSIELHCMLEQPEALVERALRQGFQSLVIHPETLTDRELFLDQTQAKRWPISFAVSPDSIVDDWWQRALGATGRVTLMAVHPGGQGQRFLPATLDRIRSIHRQFPPVVIEVDGGLNRETIVAVVQAGAERLVAGSAIWAAPDPAAAYQILQTTAQAASTQL